MKRKSSKRKGMYTGKTTPAPKQHLAVTCGLSPPTPPLTKLQGNPLYNHKIVITGSRAEYPRANVTRFERIVTRNNTSTHYVIKIDEKPGTNGTNTQVVDLIRRYVHLMVLNLGPAVICPAERDPAALDADVVTAVAVGAAAQVVCGENDADVAAVRVVDGQVHVEGDGVAKHGAERRFARVDAAGLHDARPRVEATIGDAPARHLGAEGLGHSRQHGYEAKRGRCIEDAHPTAPGAELAVAH